MSDLSAPPVAPTQPSAEQVDNIVKVRLSEASTAAAVMATRPGWRTTEFWLTLFVTVAGILAPLHGGNVFAQSAGAIAAALVSMGYISGRSKVKAS